MGNGAGRGHQADFAVKRGDGRTSGGDHFREGVTLTQNAIAAGNPGGDVPANLACGFCRRPVQGVFYGGDWRQFQPNPPGAQ